MTRRGAHDVIALHADPASWQSWDRPSTQVTADSEYAEDLVCARAKTGLDEAVITGVATIRGHRIAMLVRLRFSWGLDRNRGKRPSGRGDSAGHH